MTAATVSAFSVAFVPARSRAMKRGNCVTVSARFAQTVVTFAGMSANATARFAAPVAMTTAVDITVAMMIAGAATATIDAGEARAVIRSSEMAAVDATANNLRFKPKPVS